MRKELGMFIALLGLCAVIGVSNPAFYGESNVLNTSRQIAMLGIYAIGISFVIITGGIDLSVGSVVGLTGVIIARISAPALEGGVVSGAGYPIWVGITVAVAVALLIGLAQGLLITRLGLQPFIVTLGGMLFVRGISQTIAEGGNISFRNHPFLDFADRGVSVGKFLLPYPVVLCFVVFLIFAYVLHFTVFGRHLYAIGGNREAAEYSGIPVRRVETTAYVISAGLAGLAGIAYAAYIGQMSHAVGVAYELSAIAAVVLGGCSLRGGEGTILGVLIGSAVIQILDNGFNMFQVPYTDASGAVRSWRLNENWKNIVNGGVILVAVILDQVTHMFRARKRTLRSREEKKT
jgi:ribose transport system permease protein